MTRKLNRVILKISGGNYQPDTGLTVTLRTDEGSPITVGTATESPASSGQYTVSWTSTEKWGYWYVGGSRMTDWGTLWLGSEPTTPGGNTLLALDSGGTDRVGLSLTADRVLISSSSGALTTSAALTYSTGTGILAVSGVVSAVRATLTQTTGTAPMTISSTTVVSNLNADLLDGNHASAFLTSSVTLTMTGTANQVSVTNSGVPLDLSVNRSWTFSTPQDIATSSSPTFANLTVSTKANVGPGAATGEQLLNVGGSTGTVCAISLTQASIVAWRIGTTASSNVLKMDGSTADLSTPKWQLSATGDQTITGLYTATHAGTDFFLGLSTGTTSRIWLRNSTTTNGLLLQEDSKTAYLWNYENDHLFLATNNQVVLSLLNSRDVGVYGGIGAETYVSQTTGWKVTHSGDADFRYLYTDSLHAKAFIADIEQALAGGQIIAKSVAKLAGDSTLGNDLDIGTDTKMIVESFAGFDSIGVFENNDLVRVRSFSRSAGSLTITDAWVEVTLDTTYGSSGFDAATKTQRYNITKKSGTNGAYKVGTLALDYGKLVSGSTYGGGIIESTTVDGSYGANSPYIDIKTWATNPYTDISTKARYGRLVGVSDPTFGTLQGFGLYSQNVYLAGNAQIAGTLSSGSAGYLGSTFYAGLLKVNLCPKSSVLFNSWTKTSVTVTDNFTTDPQGKASSASKVVSNAAFSSVNTGATDASVQAQSLTYTFSVYAKGASGGEQIQLLCPRSGDNYYTEATTANLTTSWMRYSVTQTFNGVNPTNTIWGLIYNVANGTTVYLWGAQIDLGSSPTMYQPTDGTLYSGSERFGMWSTSGGFGGTIQNPSISLSDVGINVKSKIFIGDNISAQDGTHRILIGNNTASTLPLVKISGATGEFILLAANAAGGGCYGQITDGTRTIGLANMTPFSDTGNTGNFGLFMKDGSSYHFVFSDTVKQIAGWDFDYRSLTKSASSKYIGITTAGVSEIGSQPAFFAGASDAIGTSSAIAFGANGKIYGNGIYVKNSKDWLIEGSWLFGDGSDGDVTISGTTTLTRDMYYQNLTVTSTLNTGGYRIFVQNTLTLNGGTIRNIGSAGGNGANASFTTSSTTIAGADPGPGGSGGAEGTLKGGSAGKTGGAGGGWISGANDPAIAGTVGETISVGIDGTSGTAGGDGGTPTTGDANNGGAGGAGGGATTNTAGTKLGSIDPHILLTMRDILGSQTGADRVSIRPGNGSGGGGGSMRKAATYASGGGGGGSGGNGGIVVISARIIVVSSSHTISAAAGDGGTGGDYYNGTGASAPGGGGAGGNGGAVIIVTSTDMGFASYTSGTSTFTWGSLTIAVTRGTGGSPGAGGGGATSGANGLHGYLIYRRV